MLSRLLAKSKQDGCGLLAPRVHLCACMCVCSWLHGSFFHQFTPSSWFAPHCHPAPSLGGISMRSTLSCTGLRSKLVAVSCPSFALYKSMKSSIPSEWLWYRIVIQESLHLKEKKTPSLGRRTEREWRWIWTREERLWWTTIWVGTAWRYYRYPAVLPFFQVTILLLHGDVLHIYACTWLVFVHKIHHCQPEQIQPLWLKPTERMMRRKWSKLWASLPWMMMHCLLHSSNVSLVLLQSGELRCIMFAVSWKSWMKYLKHFRRYSSQCIVSTILFFCLHVYGNCGSSSCKSGNKVLISAFWFHTTIW